MVGCAGIDEPDRTDQISSEVVVQTGVDYAWSRPSPSGLRSAGYTFAVRYLSYDTTGKNLTASEARALQAAGVDVVSNWEYGASDALKGSARGASDAQEALRQATAAGMPAGRPIYFSVDFDATEAQQAAINDYFDGVSSVLGTARTGAYGGFYPIQRLFNAGKIAWGWQTFAWSGGQWDARAQLRQVRNGVTIAGGDCDIDEAQTADFGQWGHTGSGRISNIYAVGAGVTSGIDLLVATSTGTAFKSFSNGLHADGYGWGGLKVVAGDFNGDGRMDIGAIGAGVDGHSVDLLVALANASGGFSPMTNWRHADGYGWNGMNVIAGDFNGDGRWDIGAIGAGVPSGVDLLIATSTGSGFNAMVNWRHADGFGWGGMKPVAGDFNGDGRWDIGAIGDGVSGGVDLLVATSTGSGFNPIGNWRHADGFGWGGMKPVAGDFNGDGRWDIGAIGDGVPSGVDLLIATSTGSGFNPIGNWRHADGFGWGGLKPASL
ncbi:MAG TPA: glycoside hydrolase domain-containing protein [Kofleriaceae bacterium]